MAYSKLANRIWRLARSWCAQTHALGLPLLAGTLGFVAMLCSATSVWAHDVATPATPAASLAAEGLLTDEMLCGAGYRIEGTDLCTHGSDAAPPDFAGNLNLPPSDEPDWPKAVICNGDGTSGKRVQLMYVRQEDVPDRYDQSVDAIRSWAADMDDIFEASARETGGHRRIRFVTDPHCQLVVLNVELPALEHDTFSGMIAALVKLGYNSPDRKYVAFVEASIYCGIGTIARDSSPSPENRSNQRAGYARIDRDCWGGQLAAHELVHTLGGVQMDAPHASGGWHCVDEFDLMCYSDTPLFPTLQFVCPGSHEPLLDCNHDDYYHTNPPADSYLATHWNVANSAFLMARDELHNTRPTVNLFTLADSAASTAPATLTFTAQVADPDGIVTRVEFYHGATLLASDTTSPFGFTWKAVGSGTYTVTATVYDDLETSTTSNPLTLVVAAPVNTPPVISLAPLAAITGLTAPATLTFTAQVADPDGIVTRVEFYHGATLLASDTTSPFGFTWKAVGSGTYTVTATVYDDREASTTSNPLTLVVAAPVNTPPVISLAPLAAITGLTAPATLAVTAQVADPDGSVTRVEFYNGATLLATATTSPYSFTWAGVTSGTYTLTATVYDDQEVSTTSSPLIIEVAQPTVQPTDQQHDEEQSLPSQVYLPLVVKTQD